MLKRRGTWRGTSIYFVSCYLFHPFLSQAVKCHCVLLVLTLQMKTLRLREVSELAQSHTAKKLWCIYFQSCQGGGGWAKVEPEDGVRKQELKPSSPETASSPGQPKPLAAALCKARGWPEMFCLTNARWLIWGEFAPL